MIHFHVIMKFYFSGYLSWTHIAEFIFGITKIYLHKFVISKSWDNADSLNPFLSKTRISIAAIVKKNKLKLILININ